MIAERDADVATGGAPERPRILPVDLAAVIGIEKGDGTEIAAEIATEVASETGNLENPPKNETTVGVQDIIALVTKIRGVIAARWLGAERALP